MMGQRTEPFHQTQEAIISEPYVCELSSQSQQMLGLMQMETVLQILCESHAEMVRLGPCSSDPSYFEESPHDRRPTGQAHHLLHSILVRIINKSKPTVGAPPLFLFVSKYFRKQFFESESSPVW